ncbi:hypothetical protein HYW21_09350 [Candidatus Woesearchaeota archaeon]|nr:hypothetical protein [Candidatus Woesearchaeota archaeon]
MNKWLMFGTSIVIMLLVLSLVAAVPTPEEIRAKRSASAKTTADQLKKIADDVTPSTLPDTTLYKKAVDYYLASDSLSGTSKYQQEIQDLNQKIGNITGVAPPPRTTPPGTTPPGTTPPGTTPPGTTPPGTTPPGTTPPGTTPPGGGTEEHKITITNPELIPDNLKCERNAELSFNIDNVGGYDEEGIVVDIRSTDGIVNWEPTSAYSLERGTGIVVVYPITVDDDADEGDYSLVVEVFYNQNQLSDSMVVSFTVESCGVGDKTVDFGSKALSVAGDIVNPNTLVGRSAYSLIIAALLLFVALRIQRGISSARESRIRRAGAEDVEGAVHAATGTVEDALGGGARGLPRGGGGAAGGFNPEELVTRYHEIRLNIREILANVRDNAEDLYKPRKRFRSATETPFAERLKWLIAWIKKTIKQCDALKSEKHPVHFFNQLSDLRDDSIFGLQSYLDGFPEVNEGLADSEKGACTQIINVIKHAIEELRGLDIPPPLLVDNDESDQRGKRTWRRGFRRTTLEPVAARNERARQAHVTNSIHRITHILTSLNRVVEERIRSNATPEIHDDVIRVLSIGYVFDGSDGFVNEFIATGLNQDAFFNETFNLHYQIMRFIYGAHWASKAFEERVIPRIIDLLSGEGGALPTLGQYAVQLTDMIPYPDRYRLTRERISSLQTIHSELRRAIPQLEAILRELGGHPPEDAGGSHSGSADWDTPPRSGTDGDAELRPYRSALRNCLRITNNIERGVDSIRRSLADGNLRTYLNVVLADIDRYELRLKNITFESLDHLDTDGSALTTIRYHLCSYVLPQQGATFTEKYGELFAGIPADEAVARANEVIDILQTGINELAAVDIPYAEPITPTVIPSVVPPSGDRAPPPSSLPPRSASGADDAQLQACRKAQRDCVRITDDISRGVEGIRYSLENDNRFMAFREFLRDSILQAISRYSNKFSNWVRFDSSVDLRTSIQQLVQIRSDISGTDLPRLGRKLTSSYETLFTGVPSDEATIQIGRVLQTLQAGIDELAAVNIPASGPIVDPPRIHPFVPPRE